MALQDYLPVDSSTDPEGDDFACCVDERGSQRYLDVLPLNGSLQVTQVGKELYGPASPVT